MKPKYKWLILRNDWTNEPILDDSGNYMSWAENIPYGWHKAFGEQMIDELNTLLEKYNHVDNYKILQIKEKYGSIRWYDNGYPSEMDKEYWEWLNKYERLSLDTCITCGSPATHMTKGWILPKCDRCDLRRCE
jgi:hypothetical protein